MKFVDDQIVYVDESDSEHDSSLRLRSQFRQLPGVERRCGADRQVEGRFHAAR